MKKVLIVGSIAAAVAAAVATTVYLVQKHSDKDVELTKRDDDLEDEVEPANNTIGPEDYAE